MAYWSRKDAHHRYQWQPKSWRKYGHYTAGGFDGSKKRRFRGEVDADFRLQAGALQRLFSLFHQQEVRHQGRLRENLPRNAQS
jgi:hypothetical protein